MTLCIVPTKLSSLLSLIINSILFFKALYPGGPDGSGSPGDYLDSGESLLDEGEVK